MAEPLKYDPLRVQSIVNDFYKSTGEQPSGREGRPGLAEWGEDLGQIDPRVLKAVRAGVKANVMPTKSTPVPYGGLLESTTSLPALPFFIGDLLTGGKHELAKKAPEFAVEASDEYDRLVNKYLQKEGLDEATRLSGPQQFGLAAGEMIGQLPIPGRILKKVTNVLPAALKPAGWLAEYFGPTIEPKVSNYAVGTGVGGTLRTATSEPEGYGKGGLTRIDRAVAKVRPVEELGKPSFDVSIADPRKRFAGYHITQDLPAVLRSGVLTNAGIGAENLQGFPPAHVGGAYFYTDPKLAAAQRERVLEMIYADGKISTEEYPILKMLLQRDERKFAPDEDVGLNIPWTESHKQGSIATLDPVGLENLLKIYSGNPEATKDLVRDKLKAEGYAKGGLRRAPIRATAEGVVETLPPKLEGTTVVKQPGGDWMTGGIDRLVDLLRDSYKTAGERPRNRIPRHEALLQDPTVSVADLPRIQEHLEVERARDVADRWLETKLADYIKNDMATERDPVRIGIERRAKQAEETKARANERIARSRAKIAEAQAAGKDVRAASARVAFDEAEAQRRYELDKIATSHISHRFETGPSELSIDADYDAMSSLDPAIKQMGATYPSKYWERAADKTIDATLARLYQSPANIADKPWLAKVPPDRPIYAFDPPNSDSLNFGRLARDIKESVDPTSDIPNELRLKPDDVQKMNMDAAVAHSGKLAAWRQRKDIEHMLLKSRSPALTSHKEYPGTGLEWKEFVMPTDLEIPQVESKQRSATQGSFRFPGDDEWYEIAGSPLDFEKAAREVYPAKMLRGALEYEGSKMGHCVGRDAGYCNLISEGKSKIFSLRDANGEPHVTIEVIAPELPKIPDEFLTEENSFIKALTDDEKVRYIDELEKERTRRGLFLSPRQGIKEALTNSGLYTTVLDRLGVQYDNRPTIKQIKGKGNMKPADKYIPFVQDFVRSGDYANIVDIENADMRRLVPNGSIEEALRQAGREVPQFITLDERKALQEWVQKGENRGEPPKGFAEGGAVEYDESRVKKLVDDFRQTMLGVPRKLKQAAADITEIGPIIKRSNEIPLKYFDEKTEVDGAADAMRHILFQGQLMRKYGETPAKTISYVHEYTSPGQAAEARAMDLYNDEIGRELGRVAKSDEELIDLAAKYVRSGKAKTLSGSRGGY